MARILVAVLLLTLALAPIADAQGPGRGGTPFAGWFNAFNEAIDWLFSWIPERSAPAKHGACIEPSGIQATSSGVRSTTAKHGACIEPSGIRSAPQKHGACIEPSGLTACTTS